jgi:acetyl esterase/lipase
MRQARAGVAPDAAPRMAARLQAQGVDVVVETLPGLSHGQTLGASLPRLLERLAGSTPQP